MDSLVSATWTGRKSAGAVDIDTVSTAGEIVPAPRRSMREPAMAEVRTSIFDGPPGASNGAVLLVAEKEAL